jgi:hypothetical protein
MSDPLGQSAGAVFKKILAAARAHGIDVFVLPSPDQSYGLAYRGPDRRSYIHVSGDLALAETSKILAHELAHHVLGHMDFAVSSHDMHEMEYEAESWALDHIGQYFSKHAMFCLREQARDYMRMLIELTFDDVYTERPAVRDIMVWAGCDMRWLDV